MRTSTLLLGILLLAVLVVPADASSKAEAKKALKDYKKAYTGVLIKQKTYGGKGLDRDLRRAWGTYILPILDRNKPGAPKEVIYDFSGYDAAYEKWMQFEVEKGKLSVELSKVAGGEEVAKRLVSRLLEVLTEIYKRNLDFQSSRPKNYSVHDQTAGIYRYGALLHHDLLVEAIGNLKDDEAIGYLLEDGWEKALKWERGRNTDLARIALLDAWAKTKTSAAMDVLQEALQSPEQRIRIVAVEGLAVVGVDEDSLRKRLLIILRKDPCFAVRVTALDTLGGEAADPRLVPEIADILDAELMGANGVMRSHLRNALLGIVGKDMGPSPDSWKAWYKRNMDAIEAGTWEKGQDEGMTADDDKDSVAFYDIRTLSKRFIILVDASDTLITPVDIEIAKTKSFFEWNAMSKNEREKFVSQYDLLKKETLRTIEKLRPSAQFQIVIMNKSSQLFPFEPRGLAKADDNTKKRVRPWLDDVVVGGWAPQLHGIWAAYEMIGSGPWDAKLPDEPAADTIFLLTDGVPCGGQIMYGPALVDEVRRHHRYMRTPIHCIRIANYKEVAEDMMKGIAEVTGGTYVFREKP